MQNDDRKNKNEGPVIGHSLMSKFDIHLFKEGRHFKLYEKLGSHIIELKGQKGTFFGLWAPNANKVGVIGNFNGWNHNSHLLFPRGDGSGIWEGFIPGIGHGEAYKYHIVSNHQNYSVEKGDPFAFKWEEPPRTASVIWDNDFSWTDKEWLADRKKTAHKPKPFSVYEMHIGSWQRCPEEGNRYLSYRELAGKLPGYLKEMGFTHVEFMPVMEHPFYGSWGYQVTGYFAPSSRFGAPQDLMFLVNELHRQGIGVILDWVPSHFPSDQHGLSYFDGSHLYEHQDLREGYHPDWKSYIFNYGRNEVRCFLISNALFWLEKYHADGLRVDAVASMLYRDYSRKEGEWIKNQFGGRENLEAISFIKQVNEAAHEEFPDIYTIAEESTAWPMVSLPTYVGGLGFDMKWMMGWMHDTLSYFSKEPVHRKYHQHEITFSIIYAFGEKYMLPLSHDEVVHGKGSMINKMPGDDWQRFANLRLLYSYMYAHPGSKLLFMGNEFGQTAEWAHDSSLDWHLLHYGYHQGIKKTVQRLNEIYKSEKALYDLQYENSGFEWIDFNDTTNSVISFIRKGDSPDDTILVVCNFTPVARHDYHIGVPAGGKWVELFNSDDAEFGGSNARNQHEIHAWEQVSHNRLFTLSLTLPPLGIIYMKHIPHDTDYTK
ncbi:MAG: 1,4-alpha-glucan branching protein GlgB [Bacteroidales bacterium]